MIYKKYRDGISIPWIKNKKWCPFGLCFRPKRTKDRGIGIWSKSEEWTIYDNDIDASFLVYINFSLWWTLKIEISPSNG